MASRKTLNAESLEALGALDIAEVIVAPNLDGGVVAIFVGVPDLREKALQLRQRLLASAVTHPRDLRQPLADGVGEDVHEALQRLGRRIEAFDPEVVFQFSPDHYNGFFYDYTDDRYPAIIFGGPDVTDPANFQLSELRDRPSYVEDSFDVFDLDFA